MIYVIADIHGGSLDLERKLRYAPELTENDTVIVAGDAGLMYGTYDMRALKYHMANYPCRFIIMRGNHDARYFETALQSHDTWSFTEDGMYAFEKRFPNILYVKDTGGIYEIEGRRFLFIPGAYSVDKPWRLACGYPYEPREELTVAEADSLIQEAIQGDFEYVVSHTCPYHLIPRLEDLFLDGVNQSEVSYWTEKVCDEIFNECRGKWKMWWFGHFHDDRVFEDEDIQMIYNGFGVVPNDDE